MSTIVVGNGPSHNNIDFIKKFDVVISCDKTARDMVKNDIIPKYIPFSETKEGIIEKVEEYLPDYFSNHDITVVYRGEEIPLIGERSETLKLKTLVFRTPSYVNNVGLYSMIFAIECLKVKEVHLIGLEHKGTGEPQEIYNNWIDRFTRYLSTNPDCNIIDHSGGDLPL